MNRNRESQRKTNYPSRTETIHKLPIHLPNPRTAHSHRLPLCYRFNVEFLKQGRGGLEDVCHGEIAADAYAMADAEGD